MSSESIGLYMLVLLSAASPTLAGPTAGQLTVFSYPLLLYTGLVHVMARTKIRLPILRSQIGNVEYRVCWDGMPQ